MVRLSTRCLSSDQFLLRWIVVVLPIFCCVNAVTHWVVTERGRIQASRDSAFALRRPYDLAAVFQQMERANDMKNVRDHLRELQPKEGVQLDETDIWSLQKEVMESDDNCKAAGKPVYEFDFYTSTVLPLSHFGLKLEDHINVHSVLDMATTSLSPSTGSKGSSVAAKSNIYQEPRCWMHKMDFSMHSLEHLTSIRNRRKLPSVPETALRSVVVPTGMTIDQFGHAIQQTLKKNQESWVAYSMASFYWRMKGNASASIECLRRALHHAPRKYKPEPLLNLGNILHRNGQSEDAAIVVQWALDSSPGLSVLHFTLANILASLERDDEAARHYEASLQLQPRLVASAQLRLHAVRCRQALVSALNRQAKEWESALAILRSKQARLMALQRTISKMRDEQSPDEFSQIQEYIYQTWLENERKRGTITYCQYTESNEQKLKCPTNFLPSDHQPFWADRLEAKLGIGRYADPKKMPNKQQNGNTNSNSNNNNKNNNSNHNKVKEGLRWLYTAWALHEKPLFFEDFDWPSEEQCSGVRVPKWTDYDPILSPPINKGFNFSMFLASEDVSSDEPICTIVALNESSSGAFSTSDWLINRYLMNEDLDDAESQSQGHAEISLQLELLSALGCNQTCVKAAGGKSALPDLVARVGRRLAQEMALAVEVQRNPSEVEKNGQLPLWLLETLAISYWHSVGQLGRAADCSRAAIRHVPLSYRDMPLTALSGLFYRLSAVEEATDAIAEALAAAPFDPEPNYFMGCMLAVKGDLIAAMNHLAKALRQKPGLKVAERHLLPLACYQRQKADIAANKLKTTCEAGGPGCSDDKEKSHYEGYQALDFLDGTMTLLESRTNSGRVMDLYARTTTAKPPSSSEDGGERSNQQIKVEYSDSSLPYARLSVTPDGKLTAEPHLITVPPLTEDSASRLEVCLVFANGTLSSSCTSDKVFIPFVVSINSLAKHFADTLQPKVDFRRSMATLNCGDEVCGYGVKDHLTIIPSVDYPRSPATISKFIAAVVKSLTNRTTNAARLKPNTNDPLAIYVPNRLAQSEDLENRIRLMLAVVRSASPASSGYSTSTTACIPQGGKTIPFDMNLRATQLPDPLSIVSEGQLENLLDRLNPECEMPGVTLSSTRNTADSSGGGGGGKSQQKQQQRAKTSAFSEPYCECSPPYQQPSHKSAADGQKSNNFSSFFAIFSSPDLHYSPETHLQPWAAQLQSSLKLDSSRQLAAVLASHLHHTSRSNVCSDDARGWLPLTLAARYWRLRGNAAEAARCLSAAVASSSSSPHNLGPYAVNAVPAIPVLELSDFLRHVGYLPHSLVAAASALVFPNQSAAAAAASRLGALFEQMERMDAAVIFYELAASAAAAFVAASTANEASVEIEPPPPVEHVSTQKQELQIALTSSLSSFEQESILLRLHAATCQRDRRYRRAAMLLRRLVRGSSTTQPPR